MFSIQYSFESTSNVHEKIVKKSLMQNALILKNCWKSKSEVGTFDRREFGD